ncbi:glycosyltransferase family protein [Pseudarthrobacter sp. S9]|uniref:glycosyltransferase family protein n=1 Tax=Pseudarthrobacter sp. S9 TaxID=3418421 RepID=UPI003D085498
MGVFGEMRKALWHLRSGGTAQLQKWRLRQKAEPGLFDPQNIKGSEGEWAGRGRNRQLQFRPYESSRPGPRRMDLNVGVILDDFSRTAFSFEWNLLELRRELWRDQLGRTRIDFLFVESAWNGNSGSWQYQLAGASGPGIELVRLVEWCRDRGMPTVFWNKEDPPHYEDFLPAAKLFDHVLTSDSDRIPDYMRDLGHDRVGTLPFAAQPAIHNPVRPGHGWHSRGVAFAGMYFAHKYPLRRAQMDMLLGAAMTEARTGGAELEIFSRQLGGDKKYQFPEPFDKHVVGTLSYAQMLTAYRAYKAFLNVNSVIESPSMCARRIFEITASGTPVVSTPSAAISLFFEDDEVLLAPAKPEAENMLRMLTSNAEFNARVVHKAQRRIWGEHTYAHRAESVVRAIAPGRRRPVNLPSVSALVSTIRPQQLSHIFQTVGSQDGVDLELVLLTHGFVAAEGQLADLAHAHGVAKYTVLVAPDTLTLGECLNLCVEASAGAVLTKMDDDDYYAPNYLVDLLHALTYSGADVVGKQSHYMHFLSSRATMLRAADKEHRFSGLVMGPTITARREVFEAHPFEALSRGEDTAFLTSVAAANGSIYSADRFNYCQMGFGAGHNRAVSDDELAASGKIQLFGNPREHITL